MKILKNNKEPADTLKEDTQITRLKDEKERLKALLNIRRFEELI